MEEYNILDQPEQNTNTHERPIIITVICILGFLGAAITIPLIFSELAKSVATWYPFYLAFAATIGVICMLGLWKMKKWGFYLYVALAIFNQIVMLIKGIWSPYGLMLPVLLILIVANSRKQLK